MRALPHGDMHMFDLYALFSQENPNATGVRGWIVFAIEFHVRGLSMPYQEKGPKAVL
jgi:hypothetical protein